MTQVQSEFKYKQKVILLEDMGNEYRKMLPERERPKANRLYSVVEKEFDQMNNEYLYTLKDVETRAVLGVLISEWQIDSIESYDRCS